MVEFQVSELVVVAFLVWRVLGLAAAFYLSVLQARRDNERQQFEALVGRCAGVFDPAALRACGVTVEDIKAAFRRSIGGAS